MIRVSGESKSRLAKAAGAESCGQRRNQKLHDRCVQNFQKASDTQNCPEIWPPQVCPRGVPQGGLGGPSPKSTGRRLLEIQHRCGEKRIFNQNVPLATCSDNFLKLRCGKIARRCSEKHILK